MPRRQIQQLFPLAAILLVTLSQIGIDTASASTISYLRPNADGTPHSLTVFPGIAAWEALDDNVTESQTPSNKDFITNLGASSPYTTVVDLDTVSLTGSAIVGSSLWFYTPFAGRIEATIVDGANTLASHTFVNSVAGWDQLPVSLSGTQTQLNNAAIKFAMYPNSENLSSGVTAAFLKLTLEPLHPTVYWGAWMDGDVYGGAGDAPWEKATWDTFEQHTNKAVSLVHFGQPPPWEQGFTEAPLNLVTNRGGIPFMDMASDLPSFKQHVSLKEINEGKRDSALKEWAKAAAAYAKPFFFRWNWEMNGKWFKWGEEAAANPALFRGAWQRFRNIADEQGATNITWVWCPNVVFSGSTSLKDLYPGNSYVDWTCMDGYNYGGGGWTSLVDLFTPTYKELLSVAPTKPIMIGETASEEQGGSKAQWVTEGLEALPTSFPKVKALSWFNWNIVEESVERRWPIESSEGSQAAFASGIASTYYAGNSFGKLPVLTRIQPLP